MRTIGKWILAAWACVVLGQGALASEWTRVAYDDAGAAGKQPHLTESDGDWRFDNPGTEEAALRTCAFGRLVEFQYAGLDPAAKYKVKMRFFSDGPRQQRVKAGEIVLLPSLSLKEGKAVDRTLELPPAAYASGKLTLSFEHVGGPNAVVSDVEVLSSNPKPLGVVARPQVEMPPVVMPRLSPRPVAVASVSAVAVDLAGTWRFNSTANIQVPGEWVMQGFKIEPGKAAHYERSFTVPPDWSGKRIKLRCDGVYSEAMVSINGREAGRHLGGMTPFELDVTKLVEPGKENTISLAVTSESLADRLGCCSQYASHPLGGITRKIRLFVLPETNLTVLHVNTRFDKDFRNATLDVDLAAASEGQSVPPGLQAVLTLTSPDGANVPLSPDRVALDSLKDSISVPVSRPMKWDNEHPNLYRLTVKLEAGGKLLETVSQRIGFRQVEVRGNRLYVNNVPVKLHGVCRHEVHPLRGRSLTPEQWRRDAEIFREGNCNFIRTSHYPPAEEFLEACDELGLFVELEAPLCWVGHGASNYYKGAPSNASVLQYLMQANLEAVETYYNHPSLIIHSLANESSWSSLFARVHAALSQADPTRPATFHDQCWGGYNNHGSAEMPIGVQHYPGLGGPQKAANERRPIDFGEYCHLNSYNRRELVTDPGLRDLWGQGLDLMWGRMRASQGCLGGSIWAAIDDTFFLPSGETVGYGTWGPIDGWRRPKPEFWHMKKAYSPLRLRSTCVPLPPAGQPLKLEVENRHDFTDLCDVRFNWKLGEQSGTARCTAAPGTTGTLEIPLAGKHLEGKLLAIRAVSPRGFVEDSWHVALGVDPRIAPPVASRKPAAILTETQGDDIVVHGDGFAVTVNRKTGTLKATGKSGRVSLLSGPELLLLPMNGDECGGTQMSGMEKEVSLFSDTCHNWKLSSGDASEKDGQVEIRVEGGYAEAAGAYTLRVGKDGLLTMHYTFTVTDKGRCDPRQIGVVFDLPAACQTLSWRRKAFWSSYPDDHIGRPQGTATARAKDVPLSGLAGPRVEPKWPWGQDGNKYGTNDFRSTKMNILEASLQSPDGNGIRVLSDGSQHVRAWVDGDRVRLLIADYTNEGAPPFFSEHVTPHRPLRPGSIVKGTVCFEIL
jgi:beta-galactosidase